VGRKLYILLSLLAVFLFSACGPQQSRSSLPPQVLLSNKADADQLPMSVSRIMLYAIGDSKLTKHLAIFAIISYTSL